MPGFFFGSVSATLKLDINIKTVSIQVNSVTPTITAIITGAGNGSYTYLWKTSGIACSIANSSHQSSTFSWLSSLGITTIYCEVTDILSGITVLTPECAINWLPIPITNISFNVPSTFMGNGVDTRTISVVSVTPPEATYSNLVSQIFGPEAGTYSMTVSGTGIYSGTFTSSSFSILSPISVSLPGSILADGVSPQTITILSISGGSGSYMLGTWNNVSPTGSYGKLYGKITKNGTGTVSASANRFNNLNIKTNYNVIITDSLGFTGTSNTCTVFWVN